MIDVASRYKASRPLKTKKASEVADMLRDIYKKGPLRYPKEFHIDNGTEFKADVLKLMKEKGVEVVSATTKYHHTFTAFIERFNKTLAERLFKAQDVQELQNPTKDSKIWVKYLQKAVTRLNSEKTRMLGMTPAKAIKLESVELKIKPYPERKIPRLLTGYIDTCISREKRIVMVKDERLIITGQETRSDSIES